MASTNSSSSNNGSRLHGKRSFTGHHTLLPSAPPEIPTAYQPPVPELDTLLIGVSPFTFGQGSVVWKIWPAVLFYTVFSTVIVVLEEKAGFKILAIPSVLLTVLGVVIGFVISYRAMTGYDRYWMGRTAWSDLIRNCRTMGRLIWFHVPPRLTVKTAEEISSGQLNRSAEELTKCMAEKVMALDLMEGMVFTIAVKHHIRGELGIYFEDLYPLIRPLHEHQHTVEQNTAAVTSALPAPTKARRSIASNPALLHPQSHKGKSPQHLGDRDPIIPPINAYGTFPNTASGSSSPRGSLRHGLRRAASTSSLYAESAVSEHEVLHPAQNPKAHKKISNVTADLVPFSGVFHNFKVWVKGLFSKSPEDKHGWRDPYAYDSSQRKWSGPIHQRFGKAKHQKASFEARGENLPLEILRCISEWYSVLEDRGTVPGTSLGSLIGCLAAMEDSLVTMERVLTTPLPFVYSVHIRTVWIYLFFLPFQLIEQFIWYTIPGTAIAAFIYLGFLKAGEDLEQPFGYDENDLDLDLFCRAIIHSDTESLKRTPCLNAWFPQPAVGRKLVHQKSMTLIETVESGTSSRGIETETETVKVDTETA